MSSAAPLSFWSFVGMWLKIGVLGIGGPANQIGLIHTEVVEKRGLITEARFQAGLSFCLLLPGPEAQQLAVYIGWLTHGVRGALIAGAAFVLPGLVIMLGLSAAYVAYGAAGLAPGIMLGLKAAVSFFLIEAVWRIGRRTITDMPGSAAALISLGLTDFAHVAFIWIALGVAVVWWLGVRRHDEIGGAQAIDLKALNRHSLKTFGVWGVLWSLPSLGLWLCLGPDGMLTRISLIMTGAAGLSFGGAYAAIAQATHSLGGALSPAQILDGIGLSEITPGPLVLGLVFMSFVAAFQAAPAGAEWVWGFAAAGIGAYVIFVPSYMWIFWGAPFIEPLARNEGLKRLFNLIACAAIALIGLMAVAFIGSFVASDGLSERAWRAIGLMVMAAGIFVLSRRSHLLTLLAACMAGIAMAGV